MNLILKKGVSTLDFEVDRVTSLTFREERALTSLEVIAKLEAISALMVNADGYYSIKVEITEETVG